MSKVSQRVLPLTVAAVAAAVAAAGCGPDPSETAQSLPPIRTTTTTTIPVSTTDPRFKIYELQPGENLAMVARAFDVPLEMLIELNGDKFRDPNNVPVGVQLEIPQILFVEELPTPPSSTSP